MKLLVAFLIAFLTLAGCNPFNSSHYEGIVLEVSGKSIMVGSSEVDPEATYPVYEIFAEADTKVEGDKSAFAEIEEQDNVRVWVKDKDATIIVAEKISVEKVND